LDYNVDGRYQVPVGAVVRLVALNPTTTGFVIDGEEHLFVYQQNSYVFTMTTGHEDMKIETILLVDMVTVIFYSKANTLVLSFPLLWNGVLSQTNINQIKFFFGEDTSEYYHVFIIDSTELEYWQLSNKITVPGVTYMEIKVERIERPVDPGTPITLILWEEMEFIIYIDTNADWENDLPEPARIGWIFNGWLLDDSNESMQMIAQWLPAFDYTGQDFVGEWIATIYAEEIEIICEFIFFTDGRYSYNVWLDAELVTELTGFFEYDSGEITILSIETDKEIMIISRDDFEIDLTELTNNPSSFYANILISEEYDMYTIPATFIKGGT